jgi:hypothetical protein
MLTQTDHKDVPNALFLFYKPNQMIDDFKLLHTTITGERQDNQWRNSLYIGQNANGSFRDSRAEQYIGNK